MKPRRIPIGAGTGTQGGSTPTPRRRAPHQPARTARATPRTGAFGRLSYVWKPESLRRRARIPTGSLWIGRRRGYHFFARSDRGTMWKARRGRTGMSAEVWTILSVGTALGGLVIGLGGLIWRMLRSLRYDMDRRFEQMSEQVERRFELVDRQHRRRSARNSPRLTGGLEQVAECFREVRRQLARPRDRRARQRSRSSSSPTLRGEIRGQPRRARPPRPLHRLAIAAAGTERAARASDSPTQERVPRAAFP